MEIGRDVFGAGLRVTARAADGTPDAVVAKAQDVLDALFRDCDINGQGPGLISGLLEDGELYLQPIIRDIRIARMQPYPTMTMEPILSTAGQFGDVTQAFRQIDILSRDEVARFPLWQVNWIRYDLRLTRGTANGRSHYLPVRGLGRAIGRAENDLVVRRRMRAPLTRHHQVGAPGGNNDETAVKKYMALNGYDKPDAAKKVLTDIFSTGDVTVTNLEGDANLGEIDDVKHLDNVYWVKLGKPRGLMGYGEDINRDVLEQQQDEYNEFLQGLRNLIWNGDGGVYSGLKAMCDFALSLAGINPELVTYQPTWPRKFTNAQIKQIEAIDKARTTNLISHRTALELIGGMLGLESSEAELALIQQERKDRMKADNADDRAFAAGQTGSANRPQLEPEDNGAGEGVSTRMRQTRGAETNNTMMQ